jgi:hypothetical protein
VAIHKWSINFLNVPTPPCGSKKLIQKHKFIFKKYIYQPLDMSSINVINMIIVTKDIIINGIYDHDHGYD